MSLIRSEAVFADVTGAYTSRLIFSPKTIRSNVSFSGPEDQKTLLSTMIRMESLAPKLEVTRWK